MANVKDSLQATYYIETDKNLAEVAAGLVELETTGKWSGKTAPTELYKRCKGEVLSVKGKGTVTLLYPMVNFNMEESAFSSLWLYMIGGATHALIDYTKSRLIDFELPEEYNKYFTGPLWGVKGVKEYLGVPAHEPIIGTIVKPTAGLTADEVADMCGEFAAGGLQFIKDDEKQSPSIFAPMRREGYRAIKR